MIKQPWRPLANLLGSANAGRYRAFQQGLRETGNVEGRNVAVEIQPGGDNLPTFAANLVRRPASVIFATPTAGALAAKRATSTIPIVFLIGGDPVGFGLVGSLNRPGGNATGVSFLVNNLVAKQLKLLGRLVPGSAPLGLLIDPSNPNVAADTKSAQAKALRRNGRQITEVI